MDLPNTRSTLLSSLTDIAAPAVYKAFIATIATGYLSIYLEVDHDSKESRYYYYTFQYYSRLQIYTVNRETR